MQAIPSNYQEIVRSSRKLIIPLYQRHYRWGKPQFAALLDDVMRQYKDLLKYPTLAEEEQRRLVGSHYMGAVVLKQSEENSDECDVIDGQQRLTTVALLLAALRDITLPIVKQGRTPATGIEVDPEILNLRNNFNNTYFVTPPTKMGMPAKPRLVPQKRDELPFNAVLGWSDPTLKLDSTSLGLDETSNVLPAYNYFKQKLRLTKERASRDENLAPYADLFGEDGLDFDLVQSIASTRLMFIEVRTTTVDDANAIFESLNFKVVALTAVDLLKNYLFMLLRDDSAKLLDEWWNPSVRRMGGDEKRLADFVLQDLVSRGVATSKRALYETKQAELRAINAKGGTSALWAELIRMRVSLTTYLEAFDPMEHVRSKIIARALAAVHEARGATAIPLLMYILRTAANEGIEEKETAAAIRLVESYLMRRFIAGEDSHNLNSYFSSMLSKTLGREKSEDSSQTPFVDRIAAILNSSGRDWPSDSKVSDAILTGRFYGRGESCQRALVFHRLDQEYGQQLDINYAESQIEVEHIFPAGALSESTGYWVRAAAASSLSVEELHRRYKDSLANVIPLLKSENLAASNNPFTDKVGVYSDSSLRLSRWVAETFGAAGLWGEAEIRARAADVAKKALLAWPRPIATEDQSSPNSSGGQKETEIPDTDSLEDSEPFVEDTLSADPTSD